MSDRYWDTVCLLGVLNKEQDKLSACLAVVGEAERGNVRIVTSALTIAEALWPKGRPLAILREKEEIIKAFFENEWIVVRDIDRRVAEQARELIWNYDALKPKDALHVATALDAGVEQFDTFDNNLIALSHKIGKPPLVIDKPNLPENLF